MFFRQIMEAFLVRTEPDSSMVNPAHIHITRAPQTRKEKVLKMNTASLSTAAWAAVVPSNRKPSRASVFPARLPARPGFKNPFIGVFGMNPSQAVTVVKVSSIFQHPNVLAAAALAGVHHQAASAKGHPAEGPWHHAGSGPVKHEGAQVHVSRLGAALDQAGCA